MGSTSTKKTETPQNPAWVTSGIQDQMGKIKAFGQTDPYSYVAGQHELQDLGAGIARSLGRSTPLFAESAGATRRLMNTPTPSVSAGSGLDRLQAWISPYMKEVVDTTLADFDADADRARAEDSLALARENAFSGSGGALRQTLNERGRKDSRAKVSASMRDQGFNTAAEYSNRDADRATQASIAGAQVENANNALKLQAAMQLAGLGQNYDANERANAGLMFDMGSALRGIESERLRAPIQQLATETGLMGGLPLDLFKGVSSKTSGSDGGQTAGNVVSAIASIVAAIWSDRRLKRDVARIGERPDGLGVYLYRYLWSPLWFIGAMADEVLRLRPEAVVEHPSGYLMVDYGRL